MQAHRPPSVEIKHKEDWLNLEDERLAIPALVGDKHIFFFSGAVHFFWHLMRPHAR